MEGTLEGTVEGTLEGTVEVLVSGGDRRWLDDVPGVTVHTFQPDPSRPDASRPAAGSADAGRPYTGGLYAVRVPVARLEELAAHESVRRVESSRPLFPELNISRRDVRAAVQAPNSSGPLKGEGTIVAIIDSGIDYTHPAFRHPGGSSRILHLWDQSAPATPGGSVPYGVEYAKEDLDKALGDPRPTDIVPHEDTAGGHGTHVAGIAAGDDTQLGGAYQGIAPHADLIVVALAGEPGGTLGRSTQLVAAVDYAVRRAEGRPVAVNLSLGMNGGGHSGESLVERALDAYARRPGVVIVKSAGNERERRTHAGGTLGQGEVVALDLVVPPGGVEDDLVEVWFDGEDRISVAVTPPSGSQSAFTGPGSSRRSPRGAATGSPSTASSTPRPAATPRPRSSSPGRPARAPSRGSGGCCCAAAPYVSGVTTRGSSARRAARAGRAASPPPRPIRPARSPPPARRAGSSPSARTPPAPPTGAWATGRCPPSAAMGPPGWASPSPT
ncbi:S8 family serine peptidase [Nonomuraea rubra]|uniref:S8 family serine peptidase n=1 Tax=Nonomuraea rubra TaxID=46180 RepID=UPI003613C109